MPSEPLFLDANGWLALLSTDDALHSEAERCWRELVQHGRKIVLTDWVIAETGNGLARTRNRVGFPGAVRELLSSPFVEVVFVSPSLMERALTLYSNRRDKTWGLVDCASFLVMEDEGISDAFTTDTHFEQAGFQCLLPA
jgi:uncharacterized protein